MHINKLFLHDLNVTPILSVGRIFSYVNCHGLSSTDQHAVEECLAKYRIEGDATFPFSTKDDVYGVEGPMDLAKQFDVLSTLPNFHWGQYPVMGDCKLSSPETHTNLQSHLAYQPPKANSSTGQPQFMPVSPRNRFIYFTCNGLLADRQRLLEFIFAPAVEDSPPDYQPQNTVPPAKRRRPAQKVVQITAEMLQAEYGPLANVQNMRLHSSNAYAEFSTNLVENGKILWRTHTAEKDIFVLNDYDVKGELLPSKFVHVEHLTIDGEDVYICSCSTYGIIQCCLLNAVHHNDEEQVLPAGTVCMHYRFMRQHVVPAIVRVETTLTSENDRAIERRVRNAKEQRDQGIVVLLEGPPTSKYSARSSKDGSCSVVHLTDGNLSCQKGECKAKLHNKRSSKKLLLEEAAILCPHLEAMRAQKEVWYSDQDEIQGMVNPEVQNTQDAGLNQPVCINFSII